ncbi:hypothetical protein [Eudoraea chungangensis]|uniref:hypothetical protein n=1 Tax=Eudoraea chungangensis TaxID=1481905 RepID=UPI0023EC4526|nr:hypothetical protein [Eudoraea chungangensis]
MSHLLKNKHLELVWDFPLEKYRFSRFDWTGKISSLKYEGMELLAKETLESLDYNSIGKGLYNEFGISEPIGFEEIPVGGWFHKIGVGLLQKETTPYFFAHDYKIKPAKFQFTANSHKIAILCNSASINGYAYSLSKEIALMEKGVIIRYRLINTGKKTIKTDEYTHNFMGIGGNFTSEDYVLKFPFELDPDIFSETVNPDQNVVIQKDKIILDKSLKAQFFFGNLSGGKERKASWELHNVRANIGIRETGDFKTTKINLWGWKHVISPELFFKVSIKPSESMQWVRKYDVFSL